MVSHLARRLRWLPGGALALALAILTGCASIPAGRSAIDDVTLRGTDRVDDADIEERIATAPSPRFLSLFQGVVYDYEIFNRFVLQRDLARIERYYRARGFYQATVRAGRVRRVSSDKVHVEILITEGPPVLVRRITIGGLAALPPDIRDEVSAAARSKLVMGEPFEEEAFAASEASERRALTDRGYAYAEVTRDAAVDLVAGTADIVLVASPGAPMKFGAVTIRGLGDLPEGPVRRALDIQEGDEYSTTALESAQQAALDIGIFSLVRITPKLGRPPPASGLVPIEVSVEVSKLHAIRLGGGIEFDAIKTDIHLQAGWDARNFLGGLRSFSLDVRPGVVLYPLRFNHFVAPEHPLPEVRVRAKLQQPGLFEARTNGFLRSEFNAFPVLLKVNSAADDPVLGYAEFKETAGVDRTFGKFYGNLSQSVQVDVPFPYLGALDPSLRTLVISYPELLLNLDLRDDRIHPHEGIYVGNDVQAAVLGAARDVRIQPEVRGYVPIGSKLTLAARTSVGFLFPFNYGGTIADQLREASAPTGADAVRDLQLLFFRGFFSGGASSNRGYAQGSISPHGIVPFLSPQVEAQRIALECEPEDPNYDPARCSIPIGGLSLWEASLELRLDITGPFAMAAFCDASDVSPNQADLRFNHLHLSCGLGARYDTPVGPIRLDVGYRIPGAQVLEPVDRRVEGDPGTIFGLPIGVAFGIGEAF